MIRTTLKRPRESKTISIDKDQIKLSEFSTLIDVPIKDIMGVILKKGLLLNIKFCY